MADTFRPGDIVQLKSGGPPMTVIRIVDGKVLNTSWFAGKKSDTAAFPIDAVVRHKEDPQKA